jgi:hypothetical protein
MDQAEGDLRHAKSDLEGGYHDWACFSSQQAAEKAVKAVFQAMGAEAWGHAVADLLTELARRHPVPEALIESAFELDKGVYSHSLSKRPSLWGSKDALHQDGGNPVDRLCRRHRQILCGSSIPPSIKRG